MIRVTLTAKGHLLDDLSAYLSSFQESVNATTAEVVQEYAPTLTDELGTTPPERDHMQPIGWTSALQGTAFHASGGFGGGIPHERSGALPDGWIVTVDNGRVVIANPVPGSVYVYGSLAKTNPGKFQQEFLRAIGWPTAYYTVQFWAEGLLEEVIRRIDAQFKGLGSVTGSTRAYTRRG